VSGLQGPSSSSSSSRVSRRVSVLADAPGVTLWGVTEQKFQGDLLDLLRCLCVDGVIAGCVCVWGGAVLGGGRSLKLRAVSEASAPHAAL
jgi:hypothetical protein